MQEDTESEVIQTVVIKEEDFITKAAENNSPNVVQVGILKKKFRIGGFGKPPKEEFELELLSTGFALNNQFVVSQNYLFDNEIIVPGPAAAASFPFSSSFYEVDEGDGILLGFNDRGIPLGRSIWKLPKYIGAVLGATGSGKSYCYKGLYF